MKQCVICRVRKNENEKNNQYYEQTGRGGMASYHGVERVKGSHHGDEGKEL